MEIIKGFFHWHKLTLKTKPGLPSSAKTTEIFLIIIIYQLESNLHKVKKLKSRKILYKFAPNKRIFLYGNNDRHMTSQLRSSIVKRSSLNNKITAINLHIEQLIIQISLVVKWKHLEILQTFFH